MDDTTAQVGNLFLAVAICTAILEKTRLHRDLGRLQTYYSQNTLQILDGIVVVFHEKTRECICCVATRLK